ncbi:hypothetical protein NQ318_014062 [Aromia moschata]|uniref:Uncharacterized protein n=1 Tax=Aromia moschata TaxID=1265417 RepID=A0AAV8YYP9_9CUCU|nr:hypothetical protein NQ318_014062 [Aromia moschata]
MEDPPTVCYQVLLQSVLDTVQRILLQNLNMPTDTVFFHEPRFFGGLKRDVKRPKTIRAQDGPQRQKWTKTLKKIRKLIREDRRLSIRGLSEITDEIQM